MITEIFGVLFMYVAVILLAVPLGKYIASVLDGKQTRFDFLLDPLDRFIHFLIGIKSDVKMDWQQELYALLWMNAVWFAMAMFILTNMGWLPFNPDHNPSMSPDLAFNTAISFITNTNLQHYSGESGMSYLGQLTLMLWQFISAGTGIAICAVVIKSLKSDSNNEYTNFYTLLIRSCTRILFPIAIVIAIILLSNGVPMTFEGRQAMVSLQGDTVQVSTGPIAAMEAIKQIGTNGGGFFGSNSAHPFENPNYLTNMIETISIFLIPMALLFALGHMIRRKKLSWMIFGVMSIGFISLCIPSCINEMNGNKAFVKMRLEQSTGSMEGKEIRFGAAASAYWAINTTCTSNGSVNSMHDSMTPATGLAALLGMMTNCFYGGVGVGFLNFYVFIILAVFISGLMVGRTPEFMGKKIEAKEMKIAMIVALLHPFLILIATAISCYIYNQHPDAYASWLNNPGYHGYTEILYEFTSSSANNGSGFEGLGDNTPFWNIACGVIMLIARYIPIIGPVAIAGLLTNKKSIPESEGTLRTDNATFGLMILAVIIIIAALSFFPALTLGPISEYFSIQNL